MSPWVVEDFMLVWRAGACSHDGLTYQALLPCSKGRHGTPVLAACNVELIIILRHCSATASPVCGTRCVLTVQPVSPFDYIAEYLI